MSIMEWAKREVEIACNREKKCDSEDYDMEFYYGCACYRSALKAFESLCEDGHSGYSIRVTKSILDRLIDGKPLTPIEDTHDIWNVCSFGEEGVLNYQCKRMSSLFKDVYEDGHVEYHDTNRIICINRYDHSNQYHNGFVSKIVNEMFPIKMPYIPLNRPIRVYCEELLTDSKNGDFDSIGIIDICLDDTSDTEKLKTIKANRYFKENGDSFVEISPQEWAERKKKHFARLNALKNTKENM